MREELKGLKPLRVQLTRATEARDKAFRRHVDLVKEHQSLEVLLAA